MSAPIDADGGRFAAEVLRKHDVDTIFTLSGGHLFSIYDGCREEGIEIVDTRHEQAAAFAAEGWAKATREPGICALTAGPGVTNGMSALASAHQNGSPLLALGGRAPAASWAQTTASPGASASTWANTRLTPGSAVRVRAGARADRPDASGSSKASAGRQGWPPRC